MGFSIPEGVSKAVTLYGLDRELSAYERLIQFCSVITEAGITCLDQVNFHRGTYPMAFDVADVERVFQPNHGYGSPDGSAEVADVVRRYERARCHRFLRGCGRVEQLRLADCAVGVGGGATGVVSALLPAIRDVAAAAKDARSRVLFAVPQYGVYWQIAAACGLTPVALPTRRETGFLPTLEDVEAALERYDPLAFVIAYPGNPAQTTFSGRSSEVLKAVAAECLRRSCFLVVDNVYQDTIWSGDVNPEILALTSSPDHVVKVASLSKDRSGFSGFRVGWWIGDPRLRERYLFHCVAQANTVSSVSRLTLGLDSIMRTARIENREPAEEDFAALGPNFSGWGTRLVPHEILRRAQNAGVIGAYGSRVALAERLQGQTLRRVVDRLQASDAFADVIDSSIGNLVFARVHPTTAPEQDEDLFWRLVHGGMGVLPGSAFSLSAGHGGCWIRLTTIHASPDDVLEQVERLIAMLESWD